MAVVGTPVPDVVIVGGGMAGLCAALAAADAGVPARVLEADDQVGGSARWSTGRIWTFSDFGEMRSRVPLGDAALQRLLVDRIGPSLEWLGGLGLPLDVQPTGSVGEGLVMGRGQRGERTPFLSLMAEVAQSMGSVIETGVRVTGLTRSPEGWELRVDRGGTTERLERLTAAAVVVCTGGFQADPVTMSERYGPEAANLMVRSSHLARGDGLRLGLGLGAACTRGMSSFYGHTMPAVARDVAPHEYKSLTLQVASRSVLVNAAGDRFTDESSGIVEEDNAYDAMYQPGDRYFLLCDSTLADKLPLGRLDALTAVGGPALEPPYVVENTTDDLVRSMERAWSVPPGPLEATISAVNRCAVVGDGLLLSPPRTVPPAGLIRPPFYAVHCIPAITFSYGGLRVDDSMTPRSAIGEAGEPIAGVWVAGIDAGGVFLNRYAGGLAWAVVSGRTAGEEAAAWVQRNGTVAS